MVNKTLIELVKLAQGNRTQNQFALHCGVSPAILTRLMNGERLPQPATLQKIAAKAYNNVTFNDLMIAAGYLPENEEQKSPPTPEEQVGIDGLYFHLAKEAQDMKLPEEDIQAILDFAKFLKSKNKE